MLATVRWRFVPESGQSDLEIGGLRVWKHKWRSTGEPAVHLPPPRYGLTFTTHAFHIYEIGDISHPVRFAAGEISNGGWEFYVPEIEP